MINHLFSVGDCCGFAVGDAALGVSSRTMHAPEKRDAEGGVPYDYAATQIKTHNNNQTPRNVPTLDCRSYFNKTSKKKH
jgi:hypothetical protein